MKIRNKPTRTKIKTKSIKIKNKPKAKLPKATKVKPAKLNTKAKTVKEAITKPTSGSVSPNSKSKNVFPSAFPFWARLKISKRRTTLVIDEAEALNKKTKKYESGFVHREATHTFNKDYNEIKPNPDKTDKKKMYLKRPSKLPKTMFKPHNKNLDMPAQLKERYEKNNKMQ